MRTGAWISAARCSMPSTIRSGAPWPIRIGGRGERYWDQSPQRLRTGWGRSRGGYPALAAEAHHLQRRPGRAPLCRRTVCLACHDVPRHRSSIGLTIPPRTRQAQTLACSWAEARRPRRRSSNTSPQAVPTGGKERTQDRSPPILDRFGSGRCRAECCLQSRANQAAAVWLAG